MDFVQIEVVRREKVGTVEALRLRRDGRVPAVLYGLKKPALSVSMPVIELDRFLRRGDRLVELKLGGDTRTAIVREVQYDPTTDAILHVDFVRVDKDQEIEDNVPILFRGRAKGATEGGVFQPIRTTLGVRAKPADLPREIAVDVEHLLVHQSVHAREVKLPPGVTLSGSPDVVLCVVTMVKVEVAPVVAAEGGSAEPELIGRVAKEGEEVEGEVKADGKGDAKSAEKKPEGKKPEAKKDEKKK